MDYNNLILVVLSALPFILLLLLVVIRRWPALYAMPIVWFIVSLSLILLWKVDISWIVAATIKGTFLAIEIMLIIFFAVFLIDILKVKGEMKKFQKLLSYISDDARIQVIIIAFLFGSLIEGVAGFGTPAALAAPILVSLGFTPVLAVVVSLISNSVPVSFGAVGTPILMGLGGLGLERNLIDEVTKNVALIHFIVSIIIPLFISFLVCKNYSKNYYKGFIEIVPFSILTWLAFGIPYLLTARYIGSELPSLVGGLVGLLILIPAAHFGFLVPKNKIIINKKTKTETKFKENILSIIPFILLIILLSISRIFLPLKDFLTQYDLSFYRILITNVSYSFLPFYTPSFYLLIACLFSIFLFKVNFKEIKVSSSNTFKKIKSPTIALVFAISLVQLFLISGVNLSGNESMPIILAKFISDLFGSSYLFIAPFIGALGSFIAGSNTVSNLLFGAFQFEAAKNLGISVVLILSLQVVGGAVGNMIAIHNVLAAEATVGSKGQEGIIIRKTIWVTIIYVLIAGLVGFILIR